MALTECERRNDKKEKPSTKVIVRRLPPSMDQETFLNQVAPIPEYNYIYTAKGDSSLGEFAFTRVYLNFINATDVYDFKERFDNYVFVDNKGYEYPAVVEFAPFQKVPKKRGKSRQDPKCGTIESDPLFQEFVEYLNKPKEQEEKPEYTLQLTSENKNDVTTPLLEYIKNKRAQKLRIREVRREERKRREFDKRKERYDERKKGTDDRNVPKNVSNVGSLKEPIKEEKNDLSSVSPKVEEKAEKVYEKSFYKSKEKRYEEKRFEDRRKDVKARYPKKEFHVGRDFKRHDDYSQRDNRAKYEDHKKEEKSFTKKVKKYSERREERKLEVQKSELRKIDVDLKKDSDDRGIKEIQPNLDADKTKADVKSKETDNLNYESGAMKEDPQKNQINETKIKESDSHSQKRIRNKDRPTIAIYRPGMLSKRKQNDGELSDNKDCKSEDSK